MNMKYLKLSYILFIFLVLLQPEVWACDVCGCANGGSFFGMMPQSHFQYVGVRYRNKTFDSHVSSAFYRSTENFQTAELWGRFYPFKRTQLMAFVPFSYNSQTTLLSQETTKISGLNDATVIMHYNVFSNHLDSIPHKFYHNLMIGGGLKLPFGKYQFDENSTEEVANPNFQLGSGTLDFILSSLYTVRKNNWGLSAELGYKINQTNKNGYRFANRLTNSLILFRTIHQGNFTILPHAGLFSEVAKQDLRNGERNSFTGGIITSGSLGIETYYKKTTLGLSYQLPVYQTVADRELLFKKQFSVHITKLL